MAEERITPKHEVDLSQDDVTALSYVLSHVRGSSPSSLLPLEVDELEA